MTIYVVRHAQAGDRRAWAGDDRVRPLSPAGHRQAQALARILGDARFERLLSSPSVRCIETLAPLAAVRRMPIEPVEGLAEGTALREALALVQKHAPHGAVCCTHGDVLPMLLEHFAAHGVDVGPAPEWPKGCTWAFETDATNEVRAARYLPPPA
jgi:broad specificity phosphatase PhoE